MDRLADDRSNDRWHTFDEVLQRLHQAGIYIRPEQLAEFLLFHGLPVDLEHVPVHLQHKAQQINQHYQGDMAKVADTSESPIEQIFLQSRNGSN